ncbi:GGDEF domain-containing protein [Bacillus sp. 31A1R]|uniref:GGDEF domain-containing protein n=1 Tax=Robertmurraya mangrovi TaxID=3098077 RepID=A0ABU5IW38_9BACI|nr:GGDEF domain-containing protein [Bacillus sp. 31A1R]MDZ5471369.1 GGDEF domain-containing protein [Bacillus sp. 31A1R]
MNRLGDVVDLLLDMKTIFITLVVGHFFTVILISSYWRNHKKDSVFNTFFIAKCFQGIAWLLITIRGGIPDILTISLANTLLFLGSSLEAISIMKYLKKYDYKMKRLYVFFTINNVVGFHLIIVMNNNESLRVAFASFGSSIVLVIPAYYLFARKNSTLLLKIMGCLYSLVIIFLTARGIAALLSNQTMGIFTPGIIQTFSFLSLYLVMILGNTGFILLLKEEADEELYRLASYDDLTSILNRRTFILHTKDLLITCAKNNKPISLLLFDIDYFKKINDQYGHEVGDRVLQDLCHRITPLVGTENLFGRYGGDEFAIILPEMNEKKTLEFAERVRTCTRMDNAELPVTYTLSIGVLTIVPTEYTQLETLYIECDKALYSAKQNGRNRVYQGQYEQAI